MRISNVAGIGVVLVFAIFVNPVFGQATAENGKASEAKTLFNGKDLTGWDGDPKLWSVRDGAIVGQTSSDAPLGDNSFLIWTGGVLRDFELRVMFRLENVNSGIQYRSKDLGLKNGKRESWIAGGYQADMDEANKYTGIIYEERGRGILANVGEKLTLGTAGVKSATEQVTDPQKVRAAIKVKDWNEYVIICRGNHVIHKINGVLTADLTDNDAEKRSSEGILAFQLHRGPAMKVEFKDITAEGFLAWPGRKREQETQRSHARGARGARETLRRHFL